MPENRWNDREGRFDLDRDGGFNEDRGYGQDASRRSGYGYDDDRDGRRARSGGHGRGELRRAQSMGGDIGYGAMRSAADYGPSHDSYRAPGDYGQVGGADFGGSTGGYGGAYRAGGRDAERGPRGDQRYDYRQYGSRDHDPEDRSFVDKARDEVSSWMGDHDAQRRRNVDAVQQGEHRGRGPKGYRRSDDRIRDDVNDRLTDDPWLDARTIEVSVENGDVTLSGVTRTREDKRRAEALAESISGVDNVQNNIRVQRGSDADISNDGVAGSGTNLGGLV